MYCLKCGKEIPVESSYCLYCGTKIPPLPQPISASAILDEEAPPPPLPPDIGRSSRRAAAALDLPVVPTAAPLRKNVVTPAQSTPAPLQRCCTVCGRELPETSISELCVTCLNNRSFVAAPLAEYDPLTEYDQLPEPCPLPDQDDSPAVPYATGRGEAKANAFQLDLDLDADYPTAYSENPAPDKKKARKGGRHKWLLFVLPVVVVVAGLAILLPKFLPETFGTLTGANSSQAAGQSNLERKAIAFGREIAKAACANPDSVSFKKDAVAVQADDVWTITETFDRLSRQGESVTTTYVAMFRLDSTKDEGYVALKLQIDDTIMFDYTA